MNIHPGEAKDRMVNASIVAMEINSMLPACERPEHTELYEGFYHLCAMSGNVEKAELHYIVRDHDNAAFEAKKKTLALIAKTLNEKYGEGTVALTITDQYQNMAEKINEVGSTHTHYQGIILFLIHHHCFCGQERENIIGSRFGIFKDSVCPVSYTHLDVYKRQVMPLSSKTLV